MNKRSIHELLTIVMKSFFDFDYAYFTHAATVFLLVPCILGFLIKNIADLFYDGLLTVKDDAHDIRGVVLRNSYLLRHNKVVSAFHDGLLTVKDDAIEIRGQLNTYRKHVVARYNKFRR